MRNRRTEPDDSGLGLVELIVALLVSAIVVVASATILVNSWLTQEDVTSTSRATTRGQLMGSAIERAIRNAKDFVVAPGDGDATELRVWTSLGGDMICQGFQLTAGSARMTSGSGVLAAVSTWPEWQRGVEKQDETPFFKRSGNVLTYSFAMETDSAPVPISGQAKMRTIHVYSTGETSPCWP